MTAQAQAILDAALALSLRERQLLVYRLQKSLPADLDELNDEELEAELDRRFEEYQRNPATGIPWRKIKRPR